MKRYLFAIVTVITIASCAEKTVPAVSTTLTPTATTEAKPAVKPQLDGMTLYSDNCSRCHGETGQASGKAPGLDRPMSKYHIIDIINIGAGSMPRFAEKLSPDEINAIADFVTKLSVSNK